MAVGSTNILVQHTWKIQVAKSGMILVVKVWFIGVQAERKLWCRQR